jgi:hypothetical protein
MKTLHWSASGKVLVTDEDFEALDLGSRIMQTTVAARIQSHIGEAPILEGRESTVRVALSVEDAKPERELIEA